MALSIFMTLKEFSKLQRENEEFWKSIVPKQVLDKEKSFKSWFLEEFKCSNSSFMHFRDRILHQSGSFNSWYSRKEQRDMSTIDRFGKDMPNRRSFEQWKELIERVNNKVTLLEEPLSSTSDFHCRCEICGNEFKSHLLIGGYTWGTLMKCPVCFGNRTSLEKEIESLLVSNGIKPSHSTNAEAFKGTNMQGKEIDIYIPDLRIGFEINGALTHNSEFNPYGKDPKNRFYHKQKTECALSNGVRLYHIWEHWPKEVIFDIVLSKVGKYNRRIYARTTEVKEIQWKKAAEFISANHIHNPVPSSIQLGLFLEQELVQVISVKVSEKTKTAEISRLCSKLSVLVVGGFEKLIKHLITLLKDKGIEQLITYAYRDLTPDYKSSAYFKAGFEFDGYTEPGLSFYKYHIRKFPSGRVLKDTVYPRQLFQNHRVKEFLGIEPSELTKYQIYKVYDSGNLRFHLNLD